MASVTRNVARASGFETEELNLRFTLSGAASPATAAKARGNTVRRLERTGVGTYKIYFRAGVIPSTGSVAGSRANVEAIGATVRENMATVEAFSLNAATQEMEVTLTTRRSDTGQAIDIAVASIVNVQIDLELQTGSFPSVDTIN